MAKKSARISAVAARIIIHSWYAAQEEFSSADAADCTATHFPGSPGDQFELDDFIILRRTETGWEITPALPTDEN